MCFPPCGPQNTGGLSGNALPACSVRCVNQRQPMKCRQQPQGSRPGRSVGASEPHTAALLLPDRYQWHWTEVAPLSAQGQMALSRSPCPPTMDKHKINSTFKTRDPRELLLGHPTLERARVRRQLYPCHFLPRCLGWQNALCSTWSCKGKKMSLKLFWQLQTVGNRRIHMVLGKGGILIELY